MHREDIRTYTGSLGETVTVTTTVTGSGSVNLVLDKKDMGSTSPLIFDLPSSPGQRKLSVALIGAVGDTCLVDITVVDGSSDKDRLKAQPADPFPVHSYDFATGKGTSPQQDEGDK